jgi:hypothetical protein
LEAHYFRNRAKKSVTIFRRSGLTSRAPIALLLLLARLPNLSPFFAANNASANHGNEPAESKQGYADDGYRRRSAMSKEYYHLNSPKQKKKQRRRQRLPPVKKWWR